MAHVKITSDGLYPLNNDMNTESTTTYVGDLGDASVTLGFYDPDGTWTPFPNGILVSHTPLSISHGHDTAIVAFALNVSGEINLDTKKQGLGGLQGLIANIAQNFLDAAGTLLSNVRGYYIRTLNLNTTEAFTAEGLRFNQEFDVTLAANEDRYFLYQLPADATVTVGLQNRIFKSKSASCDLTILWESSGYSTIEDGVVFNEFNRYDGGNQFLISEITAPTDEGIIREVDFLTETGRGSNSSGSVSSQLGFRLYSPGTFFIAKLTNSNNNDNRVVLSYSWLEVSEEQIPLV